MTKSPVVFCHNDLQEGNILHTRTSAHEPGRDVILIDYEYCAYNYRGFDLANHFLEWSFDNSTNTLHPEKPSRKNKVTSFYKQAFGTLPKLNDWFLLVY